MSRKPFIRTFVSQEPKVQKTFSERNMFVVWPHRCRHKLSIFLRCIGHLLISVSLIVRLKTKKLVHYRLQQQRRISVTND